MDPLDVHKKAMSMSVYVCASNDPLHKIDYSGKFIVVYTMAVTLVMGITLALAIQAV